MKSKQWMYELKRQSSVAFAQGTTLRQHGNKNRTAEIDLRPRFEFLQEKSSRYTIKAASKARRPAS